MKIEFDPKSRVWVAFAKKNGRPYLAEAKTMTDASIAVFEMIEEDNNETISEKCS